MRHHSSKHVLKRGRRYLSVIRRVYVGDASEAFWECARVTMFATLQAFLPEESDVRADENTDESLLERLARGLSQSAALADYFHCTYLILFHLDSNGTYRDARYQGSNETGAAVWLCAAADTL